MAALPHAKVNSRVNVIKKWPVKVRVISDFVTTARGIVTSLLTANGSARPQATNCDVIAIFQ